MVRVALVGPGGAGKTLAALRLSEALGLPPAEAKEFCELHYFLKVKRELIKVVKGFYPVVEREKCLRCNLCAAACPDKAMVRDWEGYPKSLRELCSSCASCFAACPHGALKAEEKEVAKIYKAGKAIQLEGRHLKGALKELDSLSPEGWVLDAGRPEYALKADLAIVLSRRDWRLPEALKQLRFLRRNGVRAELVVADEPAEEVLRVLNHL